LLTSSCFSCSFLPVIFIFHCKIRGKVIVRLCKWRQLAEPCKSLLLTEEEQEQRRRKCKQKGKQPVPFAQTHQSEVDMANSRFGPQISEIIRKYACFLSAVPVFSTALPSIPCLHKIMETQVLNKYAVPF
jgi:hypothetical protein